jgi:hypothetical protein
MVITEYKEQGLVKAGHDKVKVIKGQVAGTEYQVYADKTFFDGIGIYKGVNLVGNTEDFHTAPY